jgi:hypothetical protein
VRRRVRADVLAQLEVRHSAVGVALHGGVRDDVRAVGALGARRQVGEAERENVRAVARERRRVYRGDFVHDGAAGSGGEHAALGAVVAHEPVADNDVLHRLDGAVEHEHRRVATEALWTVNLVRVDRVAVEIAHGLDLDALLVELDLVRLHDLLDGGADVAETHVDAGGANAGVGGVLNGVEERLELGVGRPGPGAVDDAAVDVHAKVDLHDIGGSETSRVAGVGRVVSGDIVQGAASGKGDAGVQSVLLDELARETLERLADVGHQQTGLDVRLHEFAHLSMHLGAVPSRLERVDGNAIVVTGLFCCDAFQVEVLMIENDLTRWKEA